MKSLRSIPKSIVADPHASTRDRLKAIRDLENPSVRFLQRLLSDPELPAKLKVASCAMLESLQSKSQAERKGPSKPPVPQPPLELPSVLGSEPKPTPENSVVIDPEVWDLVSGFSGGGYIRETATQLAETTASTEHSETNPHRRRFQTEKKSYE